MAGTLLAVLSACGVDTAPPGERWDLDQPGCTTDAECADDEYCERPSACGAPRTCVEGYPPISAAPPIDVCGCDGVVASANAGYPGPHAWEVGGLDWDTEPGALCDASATPPFRYVVTLFVPRPDAPAGAVIWTRLSRTLQTDEPERELPPDGVLRYEATGDQWADFNVDVLVDVDGDRRCDPTDDVAYRAGADEKEVDLQTFTVSAQTRLFDPGADRCTFWN